MTMRCFDRGTHVYYPHHEEWVTHGAPRGRALGLCARCGEVTDLEACERAARDGHDQARTALASSGHWLPERWKVVRPEDEGCQLLAGGGGCCDRATLYATEAEAREWAARLRGWVERVPPAPRRGT
jgi:hypothetical protein